MFRNMLNLQKYRGPDDQGIEGYSFGQEQGYALDKTDFCEEYMDGILGFNRLSIRDLSFNGHQPMKSPDGKVLLAFNGEIYNAEYYREQLIREGWQFKSATDSEVILALYYIYGLEKTLLLLNGMFAIVIVDLKDHRLILARDRFGIKPLYYMIHDERVYYASEYKSFLLVPTFIPKMDREVLNEYMIFISAPNKVLLKGIEQVCPGEVIVVNSDGIRKQTYFSIDRYVHDMSTSSFKEKQDMLGDVLEQSVRSQMVSDVKVGCQLSGGVDSSLISYFASRNRRNPMRDSVSVVFKDAYMNEEEFVLDAAKVLNIEPHRYTLDTEYIINTLDKAIWHLETIMTVPNCNALLFLTEKAKENVTVLLSGEGADEVFGGYNIFNQFYFRQKYLQNRNIHSLLERKDWLKRIMMGNTSEDLLSAAVRGKIYVEPNNVAKMLNMKTDESCIDARCKMIEEFSGSDFDKLVKYEMSTYLPELLLRQDKMSMANSIENRVPFLDNKVVEASFSIPYEMMVGINYRRYGGSEMARGTAGVAGKYILKELCACKFGEKFAYRPKGGFGLPLKYYMGTPGFRTMYRERVWPGMVDRGILNTGYTEWLYKRLDILDWQEIELLWRAINIEIYMQLYVDRKCMEGKM